MRFIEGKGCPACGEVRKLYTIHNCEVDMNREFTVHKLNNNGMAKAKIIADLFDTLLDGLKAYCPDGREFSIVKTKLEEASFFAKKAMAGALGGLNSE